MAEPKKPSLTVLGGPMAGTRFLLPEGPARLLIGSDDSCHFQLALPEVAAVHARLSLDASGAVTIHGEEGALYLNDNAVSESAPLRNGDIVWLGTPGDAEVIMLQCVLPPRAAAAPPAEAPPVAAAPEPTALPSGEFNLADEAQAGIAEGWRDETPAPSPPAREAAAEAEYVMDEGLVQGITPPPQPPGETEIYVEEGGEPAPLPETVSETAPEYGEIAAPPPAEPTYEYVPEPTPLIPEPEEPAEEATTREAATETATTEEFTGEPSLFVPPEEPVVETPVVETPVVESTEYVVESASDAGPTDATVIMGESVAEPSFYVEESGGPDETMLLSEAEKTGPPPAEAAARPPVPPEPAPAPPAPATPPGPAPSPAAAHERPPRPAAPAPAPRRRDTQALPKVAAERPSTRPPAARPAPAASSAPVGMYAAIAAGVVVVLGGGAFAAWRFLAAPRPGATPPPVSAAELAGAAKPTPAPVAPAGAAEPTPEPMEAASPPAALPSVAPPTPAPLPTVGGTPVAPTPRPTPSPAATPSPKATPKPATPAPPSAEQVRAQQVAGLLGQAEAALAGGQYDGAIGHLDEALRIDPQNAKASADRARAVALRDMARRKFVAGRTIVKTEKGSGGLVGFEGADVKTPDVSGLIEFEMSPPSGLRPGDSYNLKFYLVNDGKKPIKIGGITATTVVNGAGSGAGVASKVRQVDPKERALLGEISGVWKDGTTSWSAEILVAANKADSLKSTLTWR